MLPQDRRNELEVKLMKNKVLPSIMPEGIEYRHIPKTEGGPDFLITKNGKVEIVIECKNWSNKVPSDGTVIVEILDRFLGYKSIGLKILVGHVNFTEEQKKTYLLKNNIWYYDLQSQIDPKDDKSKKHEFEEKLRSSIALEILFHLDKFRDDCVSNIGVNILGNKEIQLDLNGEKRSVNLNSRDSIWFTRLGNTFSIFRNVGPNALDLIMIIKGGPELDNQNILLIPRKYKVYSNTLQIESKDDFPTTKGDVEPSLGNFFKWVKWKNTL